MGGQRPPYPALASARRVGYGYPTAGRRGGAVPPELLQGRRRTLAGYAMPAAVILAGVLIVIAFALIINRAMRKDDQKDALRVPPPVLSTEAPASDQPIIPIPSPSASITAKPSPTVRTTPPTSPPARKQVPPPVDAGTVAIAQGDVPGLVDLSDEGSRDWVHWGEQSTFSLERDKDGKFAILEGSPTAPRFRHALSPQKFSWENGSPVAASDGTPTGIRTCGRNNGFTLSVPAAARAERTLRLYLGVVAGRGRLDARFSTGGDTSSVKLEQRGNNLLTAVFTVRYTATRDSTLKLNWVTEEAFNTDCGGVALEAATLR